MVTDLKRRAIIILAPIYLSGSFEAIHRWDDRLKIDWNLSGKKKKDKNTKAFQPHWKQEKKI